MIIKRYDLSIYDTSAIKKAILDYSNLCSISAHYYNLEVELSFSNCVYDENLTIKEFGNYVIELMGASDAN